MTLPSDTPDDLAACHQLIASQQATNDQLQAQLDHASETSDQVERRRRERRARNRRLRQAKACSKATK